MSSLGHIPTAWQHPTRLISVGMMEFLKRRWRYVVKKEKRILSHQNSTNTLYYVLCHLFPQ